MSEAQLPDAELEVMACLWKHGALSARQVREAMGAYRPMTHAAVSTLLKRLQDKGMATREKGPVGKAFLFRAATPPKGAYRRIVANLMERVFGGDGLALVSALFETHPPTAEEIEQLQALVDRQRKQKPRRKRR
jgi:BlaI family penicillinase repressor